ncbi:hypothetical protein Dimus_004114 [Dionaea muscipula]
MTVIHLKKKDVVKSSVKGVAIEFDHDRLDSILGVPGKNGIYEALPKIHSFSCYEKCDSKIWEERHFKLHASDVYGSPDGKELTMVFEEFCVPLVDKKGEEPKRYDYFEETFFTMCKLTKENGVWWVGTGENRRRDDVVNAPEEEDEEEGGNQAEFDWEAVIDEAAVEGESGSNEQFYDAQVDVEEPVTETPAAPEVVAQASVQQKETAASGVDPSCPTGRIPEAVMNKLQAEFERARANRFQADLEKAQAENARLLALLQQAQTKSKP